MVCGLMGQWEVPLGQETLTRPGVREGLGQSDIFGAGAEK